MGVNVYSGVAYGALFSINTDLEDVGGELSDVDPEGLFEVQQVNASGDVVVGIFFGDGMSGSGDSYKTFELPDEETRQKFEKVKESMDIYSDTKFHYYFYYQ